MSFSDLLLFHTPTVNGCDGLTCRASSTTFASNGNVASPIPLVGSLYRSHISTRGSSLNLVRTSWTYCWSLGQVLGSLTRDQPGLGDQSWAYQPGTKSACLPR